MKTYFGTKGFEGVGRVTVQGPGGEVTALCGDDEMDWDWGPGGDSLAYHLMIDATGATVGASRLHKQKLSKLNPDESWTIDWYELKGFADEAAAAKAAEEAKKNA